MIRGVRVSIKPSLADEFGELVLFSNGGDH